GGGDQGCGRIERGVVEVDFFDEAGGQLIVGEMDLIDGVEARAAMLAHPPEGERAKDGDGEVGGDARSEGLENVGPNYGVSSTSPAKRMFPLGVSMPSMPCSHLAWAQ